MSDDFASNLPYQYCVLCGTNLVGDLDRDTGVC